MATAGIAAAFPGLPAAVLTAPHIGIPHTHAHPPSLIPPAPPIPLPSIGVVMCAGCVSVFICGMPAARAGDVGLAVTCGAFLPPLEIFMGSSNTWIGGSRAARMTDMTRHCAPGGMGKIGAAMAAIGVAAGAIGAGASASAGMALAASMQAAQAAADAAAMAMAMLVGKDQPAAPPDFGVLMMGMPTVLIGGFPMPDLLEALGGLLKALKAIGKKIGKSKAFGKLVSKLGLCNAPGEPIEPATGVVFNELPEWECHETGFEWGRHYRSDWNETD
jgi:uncharacterized Zn-binding protein involved in type VI secretion